MADYYAMRHKVTGKIYIGCSNSACDRIAQHLRLLRLGKHSNASLQYDCDLYGIDFDFFLLEQRDGHDRNTREKEWQAMYRTTNPAYGYNTSVAEKIRGLDSYPMIVKNGEHYEVERRESDALYDILRELCSEKGRNIDEVRKACGIGKKQIHNLIDVDGYYDFYNISRIAKELDIPHGEIGVNRPRGRRRR